MRVHVHMRMCVVYHIRLFMEGLEPNPCGCKSFTVLKYKIVHTLMLVVKIDRRITKNIFESNKTIYMNSHYLANK